MIRHEETLTTGTPGVAGAETRPLGGSGARASRNRHVPLPDGHQVPPLEDLLICTVPSVRASVPVERSWGGKPVTHQLFGANLLIQTAATPTRWRWSGRFDALNLVLPQKAVGDFFEDHATRFDVDLLLRASFESPLIISVAQQLFENANAEGSCGRLFSDVALQTVLAQLALLIHRAHDPTVQPGSPSSTNRGGLAPSRLRRVLEYLDAHLSDDISLAELAALSGLSSNHFCTAFRQSMGEPPHRYLMRRRIERAREMLADPRRPITEVALACGFASSAHFATAFRKQVGTTPSAFRRDRLT